MKPRSQQGAAADRSAAAFLLFGGAKRAGRSRERARPCRRAQPCTQPSQSAAPRLPALPQGEPRGVYGHLTIAVIPPCLPLPRGGGICEANDGGVGTWRRTRTQRKRSPATSPPLSRLRRQLPLARGAERLAHPCEQGATLRTRYNPLPPPPGEVPQCAHWGGEGHAGSTSRDRGSKRVFFALFNNSLKKYPSFCASTLYPLPFCASIRAVSGSFIRPRREGPHLHNIKNKKEGAS